MKSQGSLEERIQQEFDNANHRIEQARSVAADEWEDLRIRYEKFEEISRRLVSDPRAGQLKRLAGMFDHAKLERLHDSAGYHGIVSFPHTPKFPARVRVRMAVVHDSQVRNLILSYDVEITPVFIQYQRSDQISFPLDEVDAERLFEWADDKIIQFVHTYMELQFAEQYQKENLVTDPVLGERFSKIHTVGNVEHNGHTYFFLTEDSKALFEEHPTHFTSASVIDVD